MGWNRPPTLKLSNGASLLLLIPRTGALLNGLDSKERDKISFTDNPDHLPSLNECFRLPMLSALFVSREPANVLIADNQYRCCFRDGIMNGAPSRSRHRSGFRSDH